MCPTLGAHQVQKNKERLKLEQGDDTTKDTQISRLIELERIVSDFVSLLFSFSLSSPSFLLGVLEELFSPSVLTSCPMPDSM